MSTQDMRLDGSAGLNTSWKATVSHGFEFSPYLLRVLSHVHVRRLPRCCDAPTCFCEYFPVHGPAYNGRMVSRDPMRSSSAAAVDQGGLRDLVSSHGSESRSPRSRCEKYIVSGVREISQDDTDRESERTNSGI
jgi:hypothetical protein